MSRTPANEMSTPQPESTPRPLLVGRVEFVFQTVAEVRYGALLRGWGTTRLRRMGTEIPRTEIVHSGSGLIRVYAELRVSCQRIGHALCQREHVDGRLGAGVTEAAGQCDRWSAPVRGLRV